MTIITGAGNDTLNLGPCSIHGPTLLVTGSGDDNIAVEGSIFGTLDIQSGEGDDDVWLTRSVIHNTSIKTDQGDDWVQFWDCLIYGNSDTRLGKGQDGVVIAHSEFGSSAAFRGGGGSNDQGYYNDVTTSSWRAPQKLFHVI